MHQERINELARITVDCAYRVHATLRPGLLESAYKACLAIEIRKAGLQVEVEPPVPLIYSGEKVADVGYRMDLLVGGELVIEVKAVESLHPIHHAQLMSYLRLADKRLGLLINFNALYFKGNVKRITNNF